MSDASAGGAAPSPHIATGSDGSSVQGELDAAMEGGRPSAADRTIAAQHHRDDAQRDLDQAFTAVEETRAQGKAAIAHAADMKRKALADYNRALRNADHIEAGEDIEVAPEGPADAAPADDTGPGGGGPGDGEDQGSEA